MRKQDISSELLHRRTGARLCELRGDLTQRDVANAVGVSAASVSMYETGKRTPRDGVKRNLAGFFGRSVEDIFFAD